MSQSDILHVCECCEDEQRSVHEVGWEDTLHGWFCPPCLASLREEHQRMVSKLPKRIGLCPQCAPEFYYPLGDDEGLMCPTPDCGLAMIVYEQAAR